jgi:hypothetical protein
MRRIPKFLICALVAFLTNFPLSESFWTSRNQLSVQETLSQYRQHVDAWAKREDEVQRVQNEYHVFMAELEQKSLARIIDFDADAFDIATGNCASRTSTPFLSDLYEAVAIENAVLAGDGKSKVTHIGKAKCIYVDDKGCEVTIDDHAVLVCPGLPTHIVSIPNWDKQLEERHGDGDKTRVTSYGNVTYIYTNRDRSKRTIVQNDQQGFRSCALVLPKMPPTPPTVPAFHAIT